MLDLQEMPLVEPTNLLFNKMITNGIDGLLLQITNLPSVHKSTILPSTVGLKKKMAVIAPILIPTLPHIKGKILGWRWFNI